MPRAVPWGEGHAHCVVSRAGLEPGGLPWPWSTLCTQPRGPEMLGGGPRHSGEGIMRGFGLWLRLRSCVFLIGASPSLGH